MRSTVAGACGTVYPRLGQVSDGTDLSADRWALAVVLGPDSSSSSPERLLLLDYQSRAFVMSVTPYP